MLKRDTGERAGELFDPFLPVVADNYTFWKLEHAVCAKFIRVTLISLHVPRVAIDEQVADV